MLNFDLHISDICKKGARQINVLCRLSRYLSTETKLLIYKSFVRSNFSYCPVVWHFCFKSSTDKMENLQYRALRLIYSDFISSYEDLLKKANMNQGSKIALVRSYLRVPQAAGQVKILIFLMKIKYFPIYANNFCDAGQVLILRYFKACEYPSNNQNP